MTTTRTSQIEAGEAIAEEQRAAEYEESAATLDAERTTRVAGDHPRYSTAAIATLRREAVAAGDDEQVAICDAALTGEETAILECQRVIDEAASQTSE